MATIFSSKGFAAVLIAMVLIVSGCTEREPKTITPPKDAAAIIEPFLRAIAAGDKAKAAHYVSPAATDELDELFAENHKRLAKAGTLTPRFVLQRGNAPELRNINKNADGSEVTMVYAAKAGKTWTTATVRLYKYRDDPYKVEYWQVNDKPPAKPRFNRPETKASKQMEAVQTATIVGLSLLGLFGILVLLWISRRKPHLLVPAEKPEERRSATTVRDQ